MVINKSKDYSSNLRQRCYNFSLEIISLADVLPKKRSAWIIADQVVRSSTSIGANLVEAQSSSSRREYKKFFEIALKSANESQYWLGLLKDSGLSDVGTIEKLMKELDEISRMVAAAVLKLKKT